MRQIYDKTRHKFIPETPEEEVRQALLNYLTQKLKIPPHLIITEFELSSLANVDNDLRADVIVADPNEFDLSKPYLLAECKAKNFLAKRNAKNKPLAKIREMQILALQSQVNLYLRYLRPKFIILALGRELRFLSLGEGGYLPSSHIPIWQG